jgi:hypothetical protein
VTVLLGFIQCEERRTLCGLPRQVPGARALASLSRFFAQAPGRRGRWHRHGCGVSGIR